jgi:hypothetical protein
VSTLAHEWEHMVIRILKHSFDAGHARYWAQGHNIFAHNVGSNDMSASKWNILDDNRHLFCSAGPLVKATSYESTSLVSNQDGEDQWHEQVEAVSCLKQDDCDGVSHSSVSREESSTADDHQRFHGILVVLILSHQVEFTQQSSVELTC